MAQRGEASAAPQTAARGRAAGGLRTRGGARRGVVGAGGPAKAAAKAASSSASSSRRAPRGPPEGAARAGAARVGGPPRRAANGDASPLRVLQGVCRFAPSGKLVALGAGNAVQVVSVPRDEDEALSVERRVSAMDTVDAIEWSSDSTLLLCAMHKLGAVQVFCVGDATWRCVLREGVAGLVGAMFAPDGRHVLTIADFQLHMTVWSLDSKAQHCIEKPKLDSSAGARFTADGHFLAVLHRRECKDSVGVYSTGDWKLLQHFGVASVDAEEIAWSPTSDAIVVRDCAMEYLILAYHPSTGDLLGRYCAYENALGVRCMSWSPCGAMLAVGSYDQNCRVLSSATWRAMVEWPHPSSVRRESKSLRVVGCEEEGSSGGCASAVNENARTNAGADTSSVVAGGAAGGGAAVHMHRFQLVKHDPKRATPRLGVSSTEWSVDSRYVATREDEKPQTVWIWEAHKTEPVAILELPGRVHSVRWDPTRPRLAIASGEPFAYVWEPTPAGGWTVEKARPSATMARIAANGEAGKPWSHPALGVRWSPNGDALLLVSKSQVCFAQV